MSLEVAKGPDDGQESFTEVGIFVPLEWDRHGKLVREVAPVCFALHCLTRKVSSILYEWPSLVICAVTFPVLLFSPLYLMRIFTMYRQRWSVEDSFKFLKTCLGREDVQLLDWQAIRTLVALAWVAAGFLFDLGVTFEWAEVQLLAKPGGWEPHKNRMPGKITLLRGLGCLFELLATQTILSIYATEHQGLPSKIAAFLRGWHLPRNL